ASHAQIRRAPDDDFGRPNGRRNVAEPRIVADEQVGCPDKGDHLGERQTEVRAAGLPMSDNAFARRFPSPALPTKWTQAPDARSSAATGAYRSSGHSFVDPLAAG